MDELPWPAGGYSVSVCRAKLAPNILNVELTSITEGVVFPRYFLVTKNFD